MGYSSETSAETASPAAGSLTKRLERIGPEAIAAAARDRGDQQRGWRVFTDSRSRCSACHGVEPADQRPRTGPHLAELRDLPEVDDVSLIESVLYPSKAIRDGYATVQIITLSGRVVSGRLISPVKTMPIADDFEGLSETVRVIESSSARVVEIPGDEIDDIVPSEVSLMPAGLVDSIGTEDAFFDLMAFVFALRDGRIDPAILAVNVESPMQPADYESDIDHAGLIADWDDAVLDAGRDLYERRCASCHGTVDEAGSLPTAARFARDRLKNGSDPLSLYQTLTYGFGMMQPQHGMVPRQKYAVIHYIREHFFAKHQPESLTEIDVRYLAALPKGSTYGPEPVETFPWSEMNYGNWLTHSIEVQRPGLPAGTPPNIAQKGIAVRLDPGPGGVAAGRRWMMFDHDTMRVAGHWQWRVGDRSRFIDWKGIQFDGRHGVHPSTAGQAVLWNESGPGWADPSLITGDGTPQPGADPFADRARVMGTDGRRYGPLPRAWAKYNGMHVTNSGPVFDYTVGDMSVLESFDSIGSEADTWTSRHFSLGPTATGHQISVAAVSGFGHERIRNQVVLVSVVGQQRLRVELVGSTDGARLEVVPGRLVVAIPASSRDRELSIRWRVASPADSVARSPSAVDAGTTSTRPREQIAASVRPRFPEAVTTEIRVESETESGFAVERWSTPRLNPWSARVRPGGLDFSADGSRLFVATWDGDVYLVHRTLEKSKLVWRRIANGLFQPLGLKVIDGEVFVTCRDQIVVLEDRNGDGETDFYRCFNNDHQVTEHFHEFAMGLQHGDDGSLYYAKSARHALSAVVPHHGTLLKVSPDGSQTEIVANGFRAANGVCLNDDGTFFVTDQEGHWTPKNRINRVVPGGFYGNAMGYRDAGLDADADSDDVMRWPLAWITNRFDRSPGQLLRVPEDAWGNLGGQLLNLSYGNGQIYTVLDQRIGRDQDNGRAGANFQGAMATLDLPPFPTGVMRGRFGRDGALYCCGLFAWAGNQQLPGGLYRVSYAGERAAAVVGWQVDGQTMMIRFSDPLEPASIRQDTIKVRAWDLERTADYGSDHVDEREWSVGSIELAPDQKTVLLGIDELETTWGFAVEMEAQTANGRGVFIELHGSIHRVPPSR